MVSLLSRDRVCVACENPSPGPIKLLYFRWRLHGPFFPLLERLKNEENARLFCNGRVPVCTSCANYLQRQWSDYERRNVSLPTEKRTYRLLQDERWERFNRKKLLEDAQRRANETAMEMSACYDENEDEIGVINSAKNLEPPYPRKSKIPRLAKPRRKGPLARLPDTSLEIVQIPSDQEIDQRESTAATKIAKEQRGKLLRKLAEVKFQEELDYIQKKVQKTMGMMHLKGREERIQEIELELEEKIRHDGPKDGWESMGEMSPKAIIPHENTHQESMNELKKHIEKEMEVQRLEIDNLRKNIKHEMTQAINENYRRNDELWHFIKEMNAQRRSGSYPRRNRPYSDRVSSNSLTKPNQRVARRERTSDEYEDAESDRT